MIKRVQTYLDVKTTNALSQFAEQKGLSVSTAAGDILRDHFERVSNNMKDVMDAQTKSYFLRIINTLNQVLMCVYDQDKAGLKANSAQVCIQKITRQIQVFVERSQ